MGIFRRVSDIISANLNDLIDGLEDPEKTLKQAVREMEAAIRLALDGAAKVIANQKLLARQVDEQQRQVDCWQQQARDAVATGDDEAARRALGRKVEHQKLRAALADQLSAAELAGDRLRRQVDAMRVRLAEARRKLATLTARQHAAVARRKLLTDVGSVEFDDSPFSKFERMCETVEQTEAETDALAELLGGDACTLDAVDLDVEAELQELKNAAR